MCYDLPMPPEPPLNRILVVGTTGSGKTTMASRLAEKNYRPAIILVVCRLRSARGKSSGMREGSPFNE